MKTNIDRGWLFQLVNRPIHGGPWGGHPMGAELPEYDDSGWRKLDLPHDWAIEFPATNTVEPGSGVNDNAGQNGYFPGGIGWYRKRLRIGDMSREYLLQFDGAYRKTEVWVNGAYVGREDNGYFTFVFDITPYLRAGENLIAVRCDNWDTPNCRWYTGSGIYRHVWLLDNDPDTHFAHWGVRVTTPCAAADGALVHIEARLEGMDGAVDCAARLKFDGETVAEGCLRTVLSDGEGLAVLDIPVDKPRLWSPEDPALYTAEVILSRDGEAADILEVPFGIRRIEYRPYTGFLLNGVPTKFKGVCVHHDGGPLGAAVPETLWETRLRTLKELGCNAIRFSHNPPAPELLDLCDSMGFLTMNELCDKWEPPHYVNFPENWRDDLANWIARDFNHPSIVMWSVGNENDYAGEFYAMHRMRMLCDAVREEDPTRPPMLAGLMGRLPDEPEEKDIAASLLTQRGRLGFLCVNYAEHWYDDVFAIDPEALILGTENWVYFHGDKNIRDAKIEYCPWFDVEKDDRVMGNFLWTGIDYLGECWHGWPRHGSYAGLVDITGHAKPVADFYRTFWKKEVPSVYIAVYRQTARERKERLGMWGAPAADRFWVGKGRMEVVTYTNCEEVELFCNGRSLGVKKLARYANRILNWKLPFEAGELRAVARNKGVVVAENVLRTPGAPARLVLTPDLTELPADGWSVTPIRITLADAEGNPCPWAAKEKVLCEVSGAGSLAAVGNGMLDARDTFLGNEATVADDRCTAYIRSSRDAGKATLRVTWNGLSAETEITVG
ncbi:MAG: sugar-binding domain-containing protein [Christensenellales bacterium]|jgi:beta-galactosidase